MCLWFPCLVTRRVSLWSPMVKDMFAGHSLAGNGTSQPVVPHWVVGLRSRHCSDLPLSWALLLLCIRMKEYPVILLP